MSSWQAKFGKLFSTIILMSAVAVGQATTTPPPTDVLGAHDFGAGTGGVSGGNKNSCIYCHAPHNASAVVPLWNQKLSTSQYQLYGQSSASATVAQASLLCLSCHDGTVAVGQTLAYGKIDVTGTLSGIGGTQLSGSHPFSIQPELRDVPSVVSSLKASHTTKDPLVNLVDNNIECSTCHDVHNQYKDKLNPEFLVRDASKGQLCMACHDTGARTIATRDNVLTFWPSSVHANSDAQVTAKAALGNYTTVADFACSSCHASHNAVTDGLVRVNPNRPAQSDDSAQACFTCHDGSDKLAKPILNVLADYQKAGAIYHPFSDSSNTHSTSEPAVLDRNRHATCADCHAPHGAQPTTSFTVNGTVRGAQTGMIGVGADGTVLKTAQYQYETCLRCHGSSTNKTSPAAFGYMPLRVVATGDPLDVSLEFSKGSRSSHPVMKDANNAGRLSLLTNMWDVTFKVPTRALRGVAGVRVLCTDCHNSDTNREFGGTGPNGPHGSKYEHILERQYIISRASAGPGSTISNLNPSPLLDASPASPYALCAKCHDLNYVDSAASWTQHDRHIKRGFSCSVCHSSHGVPLSTPGVNGNGLVSFDMNVVAKNKAGAAIAYNGGTSCALSCHGHDHK